MPTRERVSEIFKTVKPVKNLENVDGLVDGGYIDSFELMLLVSLLSERFQIRIGVDDIRPENFNSIDAVSAMVDRLVSGSPAYAEARA